MNRPKMPMDAHEWAHDRAARGEGLRVSYEYSGGQAYVTSTTGLAGKRACRAAAIQQAAGWLQGGGNDEDDRQQAVQLAKEAKVPFDEIVRAARKYVR